MASYIQTENGDTQVVMPVEEYERLIALVEDRIDADQAREILADIHAGEETFPADFLRELVQSDSRIAVIRQYRGLSATQLAEAVGVSKSYISKLERCEKKGSLDTSKAIAAALDVDLEMLV